MIGTAGPTEPVTILRQRVQKAASVPAAQLLLTYKRCELLGHGALSVRTATTA